MSEHVIYWRRVAWRSEPGDTRCCYVWDDGSPVDLYTHPYRCIHSAGHSVRHSYEVRGSQP